MVSACDAIRNVEELHAGSFSSESERIKAKEALYAAYRRVQTPFDVAMDHVWTEPASTSAIKTLIDAELWKKWVTAGGRPSHVDALAELIGVDAMLLRRLFRQLAGQYLLTEVGTDEYALTTYTNALAGDQFPSLYTILYEMNQPCFANFPKFAAETKYQNPLEPNNSNFQSWKGKDQDPFSMLGENPEIGSHFNNSMALYANCKAPWTDVYPSESIVAATKPGTALVVDVGGGTGHDLEKFRAKHPDVADGSLVLQDLPEVVKDIQLRHPARAEAYNFFTPQPIKGARVYYMHCVLHDWSDVQVVEILKNIATAMEQGYSKILVHENVVVPKENHPRVALSDVVMMMIFSAVERSEQMWQAVVAQAGLRIVKIWSVAESVESVIEIELP